MSDNNHQDNNDDIYGVSSDTFSHLSSNQGSIDKALAGESTFDIGEIVREAWALVSGSKAIIICALLISAGIGQVVNGIVYVIVGGVNSLESLEAMTDMQKLSLDLLATLIAFPVTVPITAGLILYAIRRSVGETPTFADVFQYYAKMMPITLQQLLMYLLIYVGLICFIIPGIYLSVAYMFALPLMVEKNLGIWEALEISRKAITKKWWQVFALGILLGIFILLSVFTIIGWIWTVPLAYLATGVLYRQLFGVDKTITA